MSIDVKKYQQTRTTTSNSTSQGKGSLLDREINLFGSGRFSDKKKEVFYNDFHTLIAAGMDVNNALALLAEENTQNKGFEIYGTLREQVLSGNELSLAMKNAAQFTAYEYRSIEIGEGTGKLAHVLELLHEHFKKKNKLRGQLWRAMSYPIIVILATIGVLFFMLNYVVPLFMTVVDEFDAELPSITKFVVWFSDAMADLYFPILLILVCGVIVVALIRKQEFYKAFMARLKFRIPVVGKLLKEIYLSRFCQGMYLVTSSRVPLVEGLEMMDNMINDYTISKAIPEMKQEILQGASLFQSMRKQGFFPNRMITLVRVGEEVNQLDKTFKELAEQYNTRVENKSETLKTMLEPILMIIIGTIVGVVSLAMILPIFEISATMNF